jgi:hypothetical protein
LDEVPKDLVHQAWAPSAGSVLLGLLDRYLLAGFFPYIHQIA